jgi:hypothetical protein
MRKLAAIKINHTKSLRELLFSDFKSTGKEFPISGGYGYSKEDAIVIDKNDPVSPQWGLFDGVTIEYRIAKQRIYEELIIFREEGDKFQQIKINLKMQNLIMEDGKTYDKLEFNVLAFHDRDIAGFKKELAGMKDMNDYELAMFGNTNELFRYQYAAEFWFEVSSFMNFNIE